MTTFSDLEPTEVDVPAVLAVQVPGRSDPNPESMSRAMAGAFATLMGFVGQNGLACAGPPRAVYTSYGAGGVDFFVAMPVAAGPAEVVQSGQVNVGNLPGGKALRCTHRGPYRELMKTYGRVTEYMKAKGMLASEGDWARYMPMWEEYLNDPATTPEAELLTYLYVPLR
jgi:effector-binding domain-containing protein